MNFAWFVSRRRTAKIGASGSVDIYLVRRRRLLDREVMRKGDDLIGVSKQRQSGALFLGSQSVPNFVFEMLEMADTATITSHRLS